MTEVRFEDICKSRAHRAPLAKDSPKYAMYLNALPSALRRKAFDENWDVRAHYQEYRTLKRDAYLAKYA